MTGADVAACDANISGAIPRVVLGAAVNPCQQGTRIGTGGIQIP